MLKNLFAVYFSPTGGTKNAALYLAEGLAENINEIDLSLPGESKHTFEKDDVVLFAVPVFGGRIPEFAAEKIKECIGNCTTAITMVVYGNRDYDDALLELNDCVKAADFKIKASVAAIAEHSMSRVVAMGRPDETDRIQLKEYAEKIILKLEKSDMEEEIWVKGNHPYVNWKPMPVIPITSEDCIQCGICSEKCPKQAISQYDSQTIDPLKCMLCMRCISICPQQAKFLPISMQEMVAKKLSPLQDIRRENELFI